MQQQQQQEQQQQEQKESYLELFIGSMKSGKTTALIEIYKKCQFCNIGVAVINHSTDKRYDETLLSSHDKIMIPCIQTDTLNQIWNNQESEHYQVLKNAEVILINEGQFFNDLYSCVEDMLIKNKKVYIAGLDGDFERKKIGQMLDLIPLCDNVTKLTSFCSICRDGTPGIFSHRLTHEKTQIVIGSDNYIPICRSCYISKTGM